MSFLRAFCYSILIMPAVLALLMGLLGYAGGDIDGAKALFCFSYIVGLLVGFYYLLAKKCPECKKYGCFWEYGREDLSREVVSKKVKDKELGTKLGHYAVGKRKHYYKCNKCGYESTSIKDYKDKIDV